MRSGFPYSAVQPGICDPVRPASALAAISHDNPDDGSQHGLDNVDPASNGEISADVVSTGGDIQTFAYEGPGYLGFAENHDFAPVTPESPNGSDYTALGTYLNSFGCTQTGCGQRITFLIGEPGEFTSVYNIVGQIGGGTDPGNPLLANFAIDEGPGGLYNQFGADAQATPEPAPSGLIIVVSLAVLAAKAKPRRS